MRGPSTPPLRSAPLTKRSKAQAHGSPPRRGAAHAPGKTPAERAVGACPGMGAWRGGVAGGVAERLPGAAAGGGGAVGAAVATGARGGDRDRDRGRDGHRDRDTGTQRHRDGNGRGTGPGTGTGTGGWVSDRDRDRDRGPGRGAEPVPGSPVLFRSLALGSDLCQCPVPVIAPLRASPPGAAGEQGRAGSVPGGAGGSGAVLLGSSPRAAWAGALHCSHL